MENLIHHLYRAQSVPQQLFECKFNNTYCLSYSFCLSLSGTLESPTQQHRSLPPSGNCIPLLFAQVIRINLSDFVTKQTFHTIFPHSPSSQSKEAFYIPPQGAASPCSISSIPPLIAFFPIFRCQTHISSHLLLHLL
jgi:hypothetical protein